MTNITSLADKLDEMIELVKHKQKEVNKIIQSKDQQIKDLTELLEEVKREMSTHGLLNGHKKLFDKIKSYQQKYLKQ